MRCSYDRRPRCSFAGEPRAFRIPPSWWTTHTERGCSSSFRPCRHRPRAAVQVWFHGAAIPGAQLARVAAGFEHLDAKLVAEDARIAEERLPPPERVEVRSADAYAMHPHQHLPLARNWSLRIRGRKASGSLERDL